MLPGGGAMSGHEDSQTLTSHIGNFIFGVIGLALCITSLYGAAGRIDERETYVVNFGLGAFSGFLASFFLGWALTSYRRDIPPNELFKLILLFQTLLFFMVIVFAFML